jgi:signal transduction histidine kinase
METQKLGDNIYYLIFLGTAGVLVLALALILFFLKYRKRLRAQFEAMRMAESAHKQMLLNATIQSQEEERIRISKDLHDHVGSSLSGLRFLVARLLNSEIEEHLVKEIADDAKKSIDDIIEDVRNISHSLSPAGLELWGFNEALEEYCDKVARSSGLTVEINDNTGTLLRQLPFDDALSLFRVAQELINNTMKHANARHVSITISLVTGFITFLYTDDGKGIELKGNNDHGIGLYNIESRLSMIDATYKVISAPGAGYSFRVLMPVSRLNNNLKDGKH